MLKRRLIGWRLAALAAFVLLIFVSVLQDQKGIDEDFIARLTIDGIIISDLDRAMLLEDIGENDSAKALLIHINSPGGSMVGGEDIYHGLRRLAEKKPIVIVMDEMATSGGYFAALGGDWLIAHEGTITGSIGVIFQSNEITELLAKLGIKTETVRSGDLKARPNMFEAMDEESRQVVRQIVESNRNYFVNLVAEQRALDESARRIIADGRVVGGREAFEIGLVDEIGGAYEAIAWLERERGIEEKLPLRDLAPEPEKELWEKILDVSLGHLGAETMIKEALTLDGLLSLWQGHS